MVTNVSSAMRAVLEGSQGDALAMSKCSDCHRRVYPAQTFCPGCLSPRMSAKAGSPIGTLLSTSRVHRSLDPRLEAQMPMLVACIQLSDGLSLFALTDAVHPPGTKMRLRSVDSRLHARPVSVTDLANEYTHGT